MRTHCHSLWCTCKIKFLLASSIDLFERGLKVICPSVHFNNLYWCLLQELSTSRVKRQPLVGAPTYVDVNKPYIQELASFALAHIDGISNHDYRMKIVRIVTAQEQVCLLLVCIIAIVCCVVYYSKIPLIRYTWYLALEAGISQTGILYVCYKQWAYWLPIFCLVLSELLSAHWDISGFRRSRHK